MYTVQYTEKLPMQFTDMTSVAMATASPSQQAVVGAHKAGRINFSSVQLSDAAVDFHAVSNGKKAPPQRPSLHGVWDLSPLIS